MTHWLAETHTWSNAQIVTAATAFMLLHMLTGFIQGFRQGVRNARVRR